MAFNERNFLVDILSANTINSNTPGVAVQASNFQTVGVPPKAATATISGTTATVNATSFILTTPALTTAADTATATYTITNSSVAVGTSAAITCIYGTATTGNLVPLTFVPSAGSFTISFMNSSAAAVNGTMVIQIQLA
jgi:hypothetical protein